MSILTMQKMCTLSKRLQSEGKTVVFSNGCFDLVHRGHIELLKTAKSKGDILIVGINSDKSVSRLKGSCRPIMKENDRAAIIDALKPVDYVVIFNEDTPHNLIRKIRPNVLVKGADYTFEEIVGAEEVIQRGGKVIRVPLVPYTNTTDFIDKLFQNSKRENP